MRRLLPPVLRLHYSMLLMLTWLVGLPYEVGGQPATVLDPSLQISQYVHTHWGVEDGLPQSSVYAVLQTRDGYLWLGTQEGLVRFDGNRFTVLDRARLDGLASNEIRALIEDREAGIWIGTNGGGISLLRDGHVTTYTTADGLSSDLVRALHQDREGTLWIGTIDGGLDRFDGQTFTQFASNEGLPGAVVLALQSDTQGRLWIGTEAGLARMDDEGITSIGTDVPLAQGVIWSLHADANGTVWAGTSGGLLRIRGGNIRSYTSEQGLCGSTVSDMYRDSAGTLWLGTLEGGLCRMNGERFDAYRAADGLSHDRVRALAQDREGNLWIGTEGGGLDQLRAGRFTPITHAEGLSADVTFTVMEDRDGIIWVGTEGGGLNRIEHGQLTHVSTANGLPSDDVYSTFEDASGGRWVGMFGGGLCRIDRQPFDCYNTSEGLPSPNVYAIGQDAEGTLWAGTEAGLVYLHDGRFTSDGLEEALQHAPISAIISSRDGALWIGTYGGGVRRLSRTGAAEDTGVLDLSSDIVLTLHETADGTLWVGTQGGGLCRYDGTETTCLTTREGLPNDNILQILDDGNGALWIGSNRGIFRLEISVFDAVARGDESRLTTRTFGRNDGMKSAEASGGTQPAAWRSRDGRLWFTTVEGVVSLDPTALQRNALPPPVVIETVETEARTVPATASIALAPGNRDVSFHYTALTFAAAEQARFMYRLDGYDDHWIDAGNRRDAYYTGLRPGRYTFRVRAANADGTWNERGDAVQFYLKPWFYETKWFLALCILALLGFALGIHRVRIQRLKARERELEKVVDERTRDLRLEKERTEEAKNVIEAQAEKLRELDRFKTRFFANVSHEFRTPLTMIVGPLENALSGGYGPLPERMHRQVEIMLRNALRLLRLINQLLDLSKLEAGKMTLRAGARNVVSFVDGVVLSCTAFAEQKQIDLRFESAVPALELYYEPDKLEKVLFNLLSNAVKFTPEGGRIRVSLTECPPDNDMPEGAVQINVSDTGRGIPADQLAHVFDRFHQVDGSNTREHEGSGIGLSLVRELVLLHRGTIKVRSEEGHGATFIVTLPRGCRHLTDVELAETADTEDSVHQSMTELASAAFDYMHAGERPLPHPPASTIPGGAARLLVVDDNKDVREYVAGLLEGNYRVETAVDGAEALERAQTLVPDLILSDVMMPRMDGNELCRRIKASPSLNHVPVILLTARATHDSRIEGLEGGADDYLAKPFNADELRARVENLLRLRRQERELKELNEDLERRVREQVDVILEQRRHYEGELIAARDRAEASERLKSTILDNMNHELRTPLAAILGYSSILVKEAPGDLSEFADEIRTNSNRLMSTLDALLDLSRLEADAGDAKEEDFDLADVARRAINEYTPQAKEKDLRMTLQVRSAESAALVAGDGVPSPALESLFVRTNRPAVEQIIRYLVDNAVKFTEAGEVQVLVGEQENVPFVRVRDTGVGIDPTFLPRIFDAFSQQSEGLTRTYRGVGLGLTVARRLSEMVGAEIQVTSTVGNGSEFAVIGTDWPRVNAGSEQH